ncbi:MAG: UvrD-helicase domain-containing protein [Spirochaetes bacterium]|nr:UvrD-helicase domain-containing protein [Spirochaetota bacterium]
MHFYADLHIHSRFSRATSSRLVPEVLDRWAQAKGLSVIGTGDFTHPGWFAELKEKLIPAEEGLFVLSPDTQKQVELDNTLREIPQPPEVEGLNVPAQTRFILSAEISTIYSTGGRVRKVHHVILAPSFQAVDRIRNTLGRLGNLNSDGRPILGLDSRDLLEILLEADPACVLIPAHIWTPWFSALGSKSGFDSIQEAYRDLADHIFAIETGLSSDPPMNWLCSSLDSFAIVSNSDAHSPEHLGREANRFDTDLSYPAMVAALREAAGRITNKMGLRVKPVEKGFLGTIEFFPQEGKYHFDGHRKCGVALNPVETARIGGLCPVCGKPLTVGVMNRVIALADRTNLEERPRRTPFVSLIPLREILSELLRVGPTSRAVEGKYWELIDSLGPELWILADAPLEQIARKGGASLSEGIRRMRERRVYVEEGYDGEYGRVRVFSAPGSGGKDLSNRTEQEEILFPAMEGSERKEEVPRPRDLLDFDVRELSALKAATGSVKKNLPGNRNSGFEQSEPGTAEFPDSFSRLNPEQRKAVEHGEGPILILAGPGTGKTNTLTHRIAYLIMKGVPPERILALTFTNKAAEEMRVRLQKILTGREDIAGSKLNSTSALSVWIGTFHSFGLTILREFYQRFGRTEDFLLLWEEDRERIFRTFLDEEERKMPNATSLYQETLRKLNAFDLEDLLELPVTLLEEDAGVRENLHQRYTHIFVDEYQDVNEIQYHLLRLLAPDEKANLTVIGDPNQAIYGFRGADVRFIRQFTTDYPHATVLSLSTSYRCPDTVLKASHQVMKEGESKDNLPLRSGIPSEVKIRVSEHPSDASEAEFVARTIEALTGGMRFFSIDSGVASDSSEGCELGEIAVLCRTSHQMAALQKAFQDHAIPYVRVGERSSLREEPMASFLDIARFLSYPQNPYLRKLAAERLSELNRGKAISFSGTPEELIIQITLPKERIGENTEYEWETTFKLAYLNAREILTRLIGTLGFKGSIPVWPEEPLNEFLRRVATRSAQDDLPYRTERVTLSTIHGVKGLEFDCVFITGCEEGLLPYTLFDAHLSKDPEEERRLFYVGMTRAKKYLFLTRAKRRFLFGREYHLDPSAYLQAIEEELLHREKDQGKKRPKNPQLSLF